MSGLADRIIDREIIGEKNFMGPCTERVVMKNQSEQNLFMGWFLGSRSL